MQNAVSSPWALIRRIVLILIGVLVVSAVICGGYVGWHYQQIGLDQRHAPSLPFPTLPLQEGPYFLAKIPAPAEFNRITCLSHWVDGGILASAQDGILWAINLEQPADSQVVLNVSDRTFSGGESGLFGVAAHPQFHNTGHPGYLQAYIFYCALHADQTRSNRLSRFTWNPDSQTFAADSELILIDQMDEQDWHNGGSLAFGDDGFLYLTLGDEGGNYEPYTNSQRINKDLFSGVIRIDVDCQGGDISHPIRRQPQTGTTAHYFIPNDNPWCNQPDVLEEFYAIGLRSPHNLIKDPTTGAFFVTDVGHSAREELNRLSPAANFGWSWIEGDVPYEKGPFKGQRPDPLIGTNVLPILGYPHNDGNTCIIGGTVYTSDVFPKLTHKILIGDLGSGRLWAITAVPGQQIHQELVATVESTQSRSLVGIASTPDGRIIVATYTGELFHVVGREAIDRSDQVPTKLSDTGLFTDLATLTPQPGIIPYDVNSPLWSDGALKQRWMAIPGDGSSTNPTKDRIIFSKNDRWAFPTGSTFIKHFSLPLDANNPAKIKRLETRVIMRDSKGGIWGVTYRWNADDTEAFLLPPEGLTESFAITEGDGSVRVQDWTYPSRDACLSCHNPSTGGILGLSTAQVNRSITYPETGREGQQLRTLNELNYFSRSDNKIKPIRLQNFLRHEHMVSPLDTTAPLEERVTSYFAANCSHCHRPGYLRLDMDLRYNVSLDDRHIVGVHAEVPTANATSTRIEPGQPEQSEIYHRMTNLSPGVRMPLLGSAVVDRNGADLIAEWIRSLPPVPPQPSL